MGKAKLNGEMMSVFLYDADFSLPPANEVAGR